MLFSKQAFRNYVIFVSIFCFPFGLLSIIPYILLASNRVKVSSVSEEKTEVKVETIETNEEKADDQPAKEQEVFEEKETEAEKLAKFEKLKNFKEKGLITEEELEQAHEQLFGKKENN